MVQYRQTNFDASFAALSDATRRGVFKELLVAWPVADKSNQPEVEVLR